MKGDLCQRLTFEHYRSRIEAFLRPQPWHVRLAMFLVRAVNRGIRRAHMAH